MYRYFTVLVLFCLLAGFAAPGLAQEPLSSDPAPAQQTAPVQDKAAPGVFARFKQRLIDTWHSDQFDLYFPAYTWHNRLMYDSQRASKYNETPWGFGFGKSMYDEDGDLHSLFIMGFQDSHDRFEPYGGYAYLKNWHLDEAKDWSVGVGYVLGITAREQYNYIPFPLPLPIFGMQYKQVAVQATYIPGGYNDGNVLFTWLRLQF